MAISKEGRMVSIGLLEVLGIGLEKKRLEVSNKGIVNMCRRRRGDG